MNNILILGSGGHAKVVAETALEAGYASRLAFLDDNSLEPVLGWPVLGPLEQVWSPRSRQFHWRCGDWASHNPPSLARRIAGSWLRLLAGSSRCLDLAFGTDWSWDCGVRPRVVQAQSMIGAGAILNTGCSVDHDAHLFDGAYLPRSSPCGLGNSGSHVRSASEPRLSNRCALVVM